MAESFDRARGVQWETCHGPGERHFRARFAAASEEEEEGEYAPVPEGEIITHPTAETCRRCHVRDSRCYKPFCFLERSERIRHWDPRKERSAEEVAALRCACGREDCDDGECEACRRGTE